MSTYNLAANSKPTRKGKDSYHHGDLERALVDAATQAIRKHGVEALTLRGVADQLGVSRTALYRHFVDKSALLARVSRTGFQTLHHDLTRAVELAAAGGDPLLEMSLAYVRFAVRNPEFYRVMFGPSYYDWNCHDDLLQEATETFFVLVNGVASEQGRGTVKPGNPLHLAQILWSLVHGIASLHIDNHLSHAEESEHDIEALTRLAAQCIGQGIASH